MRRARCRTVARGRDEPLAADIEPAMTRRAHLVTTGAALVALYATCAAVALTMLAQHPGMAPAIAADLTLSAMAIGWLLAVRPGHARPQLLIAIGLVGLALTRQLVGLAALGLVGGAIELALVALMLVRIGRIARATRAARRAGADPIEALEAGCAAAMPRALAGAVATELGAVGLALGGWWMRPVAGHGHARRASYGALVGAFAVLLVGESLAVHLALAQWSALAAWIATGGSIYTILWLVGDAQAVRLAPARLTHAGLHVSRGLRWRAVVPWAAIAAASEIDARVDGARDLSVLGPNLLLTLRRPIALHGPFGLTRSATQITIDVDDRAALIAAIMARIV
ncbi:MAG: hypothetical protein K8W52_40815 [Deltaproteobacteria bacterium]|nr:hypothetical protein [Deltaproteobacteria bacterium]